MSLPKVKHAIYDLTLPSNGKKIKYRPFLAREEKILLMAKQSEDPSDIFAAVKQVINNCIVDPVPFDVDSLVTFDLEWFFLKLRCVSVNNIVELSYKDYEDDKVYTVEVDLNDVIIKRDPAHTNKIKIDDDLGMILKYPTTEISNKLANIKNVTPTESVRMCLESIYDENNVYLIKDTPPEEVEEFLLSLDIPTLEKVLNFFQTMPKLYYEVKYTNSLGNERIIELDTLQDFFTLG